MSILLPTYPSATSANIKQSIKCKMEIKYLCFWSATTLIACAIPRHCTGVFEIKYFKVGPLHKIVVCLTEIKDVIKSKALQCKQAPSESVCLL